MNPTKKCSLLLLAAQLLACGGLHGAIAMAVGEPLGANTRSDTYPYAGYGFYVPAATSVMVNQLGYWDLGGDGLSDSHTVSLFKYVDGSNRSYTQIATVTIPSGTSAALEGGYRWVSIPDLVLADNGQNGNYYVIMASHGGDAWTDGLGSGAPMNSSFGTISSGALDFTGGEIFSGSTYGGANFGYTVPEPSAFALAGLGVFVAFRRRSR